MKKMEFLLLFFFLLVDTFLKGSNVKTALSNHPSLEFHFQYSVLSSSCCCLKIHLPLPNEDLFLPLAFLFSCCQFPIISADKISSIFAVSFLPLSNCLHEAVSRNALCPHWGSSIFFTLFIYSPLTHSVNIY